MISRKEKPKIGKIHPHAQTDEKNRKIQLSATGQGRVRPFQDPGSPVPARGLAPVSPRGAGQDPALPRDRPRAASEDSPVAPRGAAASARSSHTASQVGKIGGLVRRTSRCWFVSGERKLSGSSGRLCRFIVRSTHVKFMFSFYI